MTIARDVCYARVPKTIRADIREEIVDAFEQALKEFASQEVEKAMIIAEDAMQNHIGYAGDYDAGATQTAKNIAFLIRKLWVELRNDSQGRKA